MQTVVNQLAASIPFGNGAGLLPGDNHSDSSTPHPSCIQQKNAHDESFLLALKQAAVHHPTVMKTFLVWAFVMLGCLTGIQAQTELFVDSTNGNDGNAGTTWATAFKTLARAMNITNTNTGTAYTVYVARGTYFPPGTGSDQDSAFTILRGNVKLFGGYPAGGGTRDLAANPTWLDGDLGVKLPNTQPIPPDNSWHIMVIAGVAADSVVVDGFSFRNGNAVGINAKTYNGLIVQRSIGGGIIAINNTNGKKLNIRNCFFTANKTEGGGGGINVTTQAPASGSSPLISNCVFDGNGANEGAGMYIGRSSPEVLNCTFTKGSGFSGSGILNFTSSPFISNCTFSENSADNGGGMTNDGSSPTVLNCIFSKNVTDTRGGAGMLNENSLGQFGQAASAPVIINCTFWDNTTNGSGGGIINQQGSVPQIINCTFVNNFADQIGGGVSHDAGSSSVITNSIFWGNVQTAANTISSITIPVGTVTVTYSDVQQTSGVYTGTGNINTNPLLVNLVTGNLRLQSTSPCRDKGDSTANKTYPDDLDGNDRIVKCNIDMGAYEYQTDEPCCTPIAIATCPGDFSIDSCGTSAITPPYSALAYATTATTITKTQFEAEGGVIAAGSCDVSSITYSDVAAGTNPVTVTRTFTLTDVKGNTKSCEQKITIKDNKKPTVVTQNITVQLNASGTASITASQIDNGSTDVCGIDTRSLDIKDFTCADVGTPVTVTLTVTDINGNSDSKTATVTVQDNTKPTISSITASPCALWPPNHKMQNITLTINSSDICGAPDCQVDSVKSNEPVNGTGDGDQVPDWQFVDNRHVNLRAERAGTGDGRIYTIYLTCTDASGNKTTGSTTVYVVHNITAPLTGSSFKVGSTVSFTGTFWDKPGNKHTAQWLIDGTTSVKGTVTEPGGTKNGKVTGSYKFTTPGIYKLQMNVTDQTGLTAYANTNGDLEEIVVIYDPNGGYTYGGGWFASPAGALVSSPGVTGKVSYGFTVNYYKGATLPKGENQFEFKVGNFEYNALNFDYLSINGAKAQFKGSGRIAGGQSGINFIMTVIDGALNGTGVDKVRIKIYNKNNGQVFYDNEPGTSDAANPVTAVGTNSTIVISGTPVAVTQAQRAAPETPALVSELAVRVQPNPTKGNFALHVTSTNEKDQITLQVFDQLGRLIENRKIAHGLTDRIGGNYVPGVYYLKVIQGQAQKDIKVLKQPD